MLKTTKPGAHHCGQVYSYYINDPWYSTEFNSWESTVIHLSEWTELEQGPGGPVKLSLTLQLLNLMKVLRLDRVAMSGVENRAPGSFRTSITYQPI